MDQIQQNNQKKNYDIIFQAMDCGPKWIFEDDIDKKKDLDDIMKLKSSDHDITKLLAILFNKKDKFVKNSPYSPVEERLLALDALYGKETVKKFLLKPLETKTSDSNILSSILSTHNEKDTIDNNDEALLQQSFKDILNRLGKDDFEKLLLHNTHNAQGQIIGSVLYESGSYEKTIKLLKNINVNKESIYKFVKNLANNEKFLSNHTKNPLSFAKRIKNIIIALTSQQKYDETATVDEYIFPENRIPHLLLKMTPETLKDRTKIELALKLAIDEAEKINMAYSANTEKQINITKQSKYPLREGPYGINRDLNQEKQI